MEALRRACMITGHDPNETRNPSAHKSDEENDDVVDPTAIPNSDSDSDFNDELELLRKIKSRFSSDSSQPPLSLKPLRTLLLHSASDEEDDYQTLLAVKRRFAAYENDTQGKKVEQIDTSCKSVEETCNEVYANEAYERFPISVTDNKKEQPSTSMEWDQSESCKPSMSPTRSAGFPKSALAFWDAIIKNRSYQKFLGSKLTHIQAKIEENNKLKQRVKMLRDFQAHCKRRTGEALSQKKDLRVQLILTKRPRADAKAHDRAISALSYGPEENAHVADYRKASTKFSVSLDRKNWSEIEKKDLQKGIRQQFQEMILQSSIDESSYSETHHGDSNDMDNILALVKDLEITPYNLKEFLPKVNWEQLASMYVPGRSGGECEARWLNWEDPLVKHGPWTTDEDKTNLYLVQKNGVNDWINVAKAVGTNRTPFQCLARYQRSLNACILKREWTKEEDAQLSSSVEAFGEKDWQSVASALNGRTGTQCSNRWNKSLHPTRTRAGKWTPEEDKRLIVAQMLLGKKIGIRQLNLCQVGLRYVNSLEPSLKCCEWTEEEDSKLIAAIEEYGHCWSKVSVFVPHRTDNMCWRRWKVLFPDEVPLVREEKKIWKTALIRNFVDREKERPALGPNDFLVQGSISTKSLTYPRKTGELSRVRKKIKTRRHRNNAQISSEEELETSNFEESDDGDDAVRKRKKKNVLKQCQRRQKDNEPTGDCEAVAPLPKKIRGKRKTNDQILVVSHSENQTCVGDDGTKNKIQRRIRQKGTEPKGECKVFVPIGNGDDVPQQSPDKLCTDKIMGTSDEEEAITHFLHRPNKRKLVRGHKLDLQEPKNGVSRISQGTDTETDDPVISSVGQTKYKRHARTTKRNAIHNNTIVGELPKQEDTTIKSGTEQASSDDEMTLCCYLLNRSKKRGESGKDTQVTG